MSITVEHPAESELRSRRAALLEELGQTYEELAELARKYMLTAEELAVWEQVESIDFLLGNDE